MDILPIVFAVVLVILAVVLSVVGIQMVMVLVQLRQTLQRVNTALSTAEAKVASLTEPLKQFSGTVSGIKTGLKVFETFVGWLQKSKDA
ncbi:MAG: hypothetical protein GW946_02180 [Candidatus Pacebacteria bacterium]|nr:hypothetical protein [Candidatus Paceibacterota bacterium]PIR60368.1 MAG: hypothetical protein COU67_02330 [Candidatus Pacebacteria bacterium CG10_big_fil_rev_8_21_14_0_10_44_54]